MLNIAQIKIIFKLISKSAYTTTKFAILPRNNNLF